MATTLASLHNNQPKVDIISEEIVKRIYGQVGTRGGCIALYFKSKELK